MRSWVTHWKIGKFKRVNFGTDIPELMVCLNHATQKQTSVFIVIIFWNVICDLAGEGGGAPTMIKVMELHPPSDMDGKNILSF